jgi:hypothetical protein
MRDSQFLRGFINEGIQEGRLEEKRKTLLRVVQLRLEDPVPDDVRRAIEGTNDLDVLSRGFGAALQAGSLGDLRSSMKTLAASGT